MSIRLSVAGRTVHDGVATPGTFHVTEPAATAGCLFRGSYDVLHLHVPHALIAEYAREMRRDPAVFCSRANPRTDSTVELLGRALLKANQFGTSFGRLYADSISMGIVAYLLDFALRSTSPERSKASMLARWRLNRVIDYIDSRLGEPMSLAEIASVAGLTSMHFAAQFRATMGLRPHEYLLRRRIERARELFLETGMSAAEVALSVGFQSQSHFTTVFKRFVGQPPGVWRQSLKDETFGK